MAERVCRTDHAWTAGWEARIREVGADPCQCGWYIRRLQYVDTRATEGWHDGD